MKGGMKREEKGTKDEKKENRKEKRKGSEVLVGGRCLQVRGSIES